MKLFNKRGDGGQTSLLYGQRVSKSDPRPEAYGTLDEANSTLGLARALSKNQKIKEIIHRIQEILFVLGAELASDPQHYEKLKKKIEQDDVLQLEGLIEELEGQVRLPDSFIIPGGTLVAAVLDMARTIVRRAERRAVGLKETGLLSNDNLLAYLNRTADLLFILARYDETVDGEGV